jgi:hypothetical protein
MAVNIDRGQISVRLTDEQARALERYRITLQKRVRCHAPVWSCSSAHAIRDLILRGLKAEGFNLEVVDLQE